MKGPRRLTMPRGGAEGALKISIKSFYVPAHVIQPRQFRGGKQDGVQKRSYEAPPAETVSIDKNHSDREGRFCVGIFDFAEIVTWGEIAQDSGARGRLGGNDEVGIPEKDLGKSGAAVETIIQ